MKILDSAREHGLSDRDLEWVATYPLRRIYVNDREPNVEIRIGTDTQGRPLEVFVNTFPDNEDVVFHAMKARRQFLDLIDSRRMP